MYAMATATTKWLIGLALVMLAVEGQSVRGEVAASQALHSVLPKTGRTERIVVVDVAQDLKTGDAHSTLLAIACLQGLINRTSEEKVYLVGFPWRLHGNAQAEKHFGGVHPAQAALDDGLLPFPRTSAELDPTKTYPALSSLVKRAKSLLRGKVICPESAAASSGARAAAVNACTFDSALPLTEKLDEYLRGEGIELPLIADHGLWMKPRLSIGRSPAT